MVSAEDQTNPMSFWALFFLDNFFGPSLKTNIHNFSKRITHDYPLVIQHTYFLMAHRKFVDFPLKEADFPVRYVNLYQRVKPRKPTTSKSTIIINQLYKSPFPIQSGAP